MVLTGAGASVRIRRRHSRFGEERGTQEAIARYNSATERAFQSVHEFPKPTIAISAGFCMAAGSRSPSPAISDRLGQFPLRAAGGQARPRLRLFRPQALHRGGRPRLHQEFSSPRASSTPPRRATWAGQPRAARRRSRALSRLRRHHRRQRAAYRERIKFIVGEALRRVQARSAACEALVKKCSAATTRKAARPSWKTQAVHRQRAAARRRARGSSGIRRVARLTKRFDLVPPSTASLAHRAWPARLSARTSGCGKTTTLR